MLNELETSLLRLKGVKKNAGGYMATCPSHHDLHQSLSLKEDNGKLLLYCYAGCSYESIIKKLDLRPAPQKDMSVIPIITDTYDYISIEGLPYQVVRYHPKAFKQRQPDGKGGWTWNLNGITPSLYHLDMVKTAIKLNDTIFIVEGEKDVLSLNKIRKVATSISGGAATKWHPSLVPLFQGAKVVIIPDNDDAGRKYATYVANLLYGWCASLKLVELPVKDVSDYLVTQFAPATVTNFGVPFGFVTAIDKLLQIVDNTEEYIPTGAVTRDEFNDWRGVNQYLWQQLLKRKPKRKPKWD